MSNKKACLHELLAVEKDRTEVAQKVINEAMVAFTKKTNLFNGRHKWLEMLIEDRQGETAGSEETTEIVETVPRKLAYVAKYLVTYWDLLLQKEATNQAAKADLVVDGIVFGTDLPATFLLGMEKRLKVLRAIIEAVPTHAPGVDWIEDLSKGEDIWMSATPRATKKEEKELAVKVLYEATEHHPAQVDKWTMNKVVGIYYEKLWTSTITPARKNKLLERCDDVIRATKKARMRANQAEVVNVKIGKSIIDYVLAD